MSEFQNVENDAEKYAKDHPDQVKEGEQDAEHAAESKFGLGGQQDQGQGGQQDQGNQPADGQQGQGNQQGDGNQQ
jgi:hypothetical protein